MTQYIVRRLLLMIPTVLLVTLALFVLIRLTPGDPVKTEFGLDLTPQIYQTAKHKLGLDRPIAVQYINWLGNIVRLDFGKSLRTHEPARKVIFERFPATLELTLLAFIVSLAISIVIGTLAAVWDRGWFGPIVTVFTLFSIALPGFFIAILLVYFVTFRWRLLPSPRYIAFNENPLQNLKFIFLPVLALTFTGFAAQARLIRSNVLEALHEDYIRTARAKGISEIAVVLRHGLRNAMLPSVTLFGITVATLWEGAVITEIIFNWPGVGRLVITSLRGKDYPVVEAIVLLAALTISLANLAIDVLYARLDPRISYASTR